MGPHEDVEISTFEISFIIGPQLRSSRVRQQPAHLDDYVLIAKIDVLILESGEPETYKQAMTDTNSEKWFTAMKSEMESMFENQV